MFRSGGGLPGSGSTSLARRWDGNAGVLASRDRGDPGMSLAQLFELPRNEDEWAMWSFAHASFHHDVDQAIARTYSVTLPEYALDPFNPKDTSWLYNHQVNHSARNSVLGVKGYD